MDESSDAAVAKNFSLRRIVLAGLWPFSRVAGVESNVIERWIYR